MKIILLGAPGAGKGTFGRLLSSYLRIPHISTGDILRNADTELGHQARKIIKDGSLVPDQVMCKLIQELMVTPFVQPGFILDGFPRTLYQAFELDAILAELNIKLDIALNINVAEEILLDRVINRRVCPECHQIFNLDKDLLTEERCIKCGSQVIQREDDREEVFSHRMKIYRELTLPIVGFYHEHNLLVDFHPPSNDIQTNFQEILRIVSGE